MKIQKRINMDKEIPVFEEVLNETRQHRADVRNMMFIVAHAIQKRALKHDWAKIHTSQERHHLNVTVQDDVNLVDVIEFICDCICSGYARDGKIRSELINLDEKTLKLAFNNTIKKLDAEVEK